MNAPSTPDRVFPDVPWFSDAWPKPVEKEAESE